MIVNKIKLPLGKVSGFNSLFLDFLGSKNPTILHQSSPAELIQKRTAYAHRALLTDKLNEQYAGFTLSPKLQENLKLISQDNTFTVTTGHQLCLFTGPLYFIYKIITTIKLAQKLRQENPSVHIIPVFWMATEDHDIEEISSVNLFRKTLHWNTQQPGPAGRLNTFGIQTLIEELSTLKGNLPFADELLKIFSDAYAHENLSKATRYLVNELFGVYGLVCIDGDDPAFKALMKPVFREELEKETAFQKVTQRNNELEKSGYAPQVNPRPINLFYIENGLRARIEKDGEIYFCSGTNLKWTYDEITRMLDTNPEKFSPNVLLRPLYQETILPNLAYIGGPAEIAYWLQLDELFNHFNIPMPARISRNYAMLVEKGLYEKFEKLGFNIEDIFQDTDSLTRKFVQSQVNVEGLFSSQHANMKNIFEEMSKKASAIDKSLENFVMAEWQKQEKFFENLESKIVRAEKNKHETSVNQIKNIKDKLFPEGNLQERYENFLPFYWKYGAEMISELADAFELPSDQMQIFIIG